jgi:prophage DNA circulation protein
MTTSGKFTPQGSMVQAFKFGTFELWGSLLAYSGSSKRRSVNHESPKGDGARVEDMGRGQQKLAVRLVFTGINCAKDYQAFKKYLSDNPSDLLIHPIAGRWNAYTDGPEEDVDFARALDEIQVRCEWREDTLDYTIQRDAPDPATAAQAATNKQTELEQTVAEFMCDLAKLQTAEAAALEKIDVALDALALVEAPIDFAQSSIDAAVSAGSQVIGAVATIQAKANVLLDSIEGYVTSVGDLFEGSDPAAGAATAAATLLDTVAVAEQALEDVMIQYSPTAACAAEAVGVAQEALAACYVLDAALQAARPPIVLYTVPELMDVVTLAMRTGNASTALSRVQTILQLNRLSNPAAIAAGTKVYVPSE